METKEKNFEQDIESWLLNEGGYVYRGDRPHDIKRRLIRSYTTTLMSSLPLVIVRARFDCLSVGSFIVFQGFLDPPPLIVRCVEFFFVIFLFSYKKILYLCRKYCYQ